jgi:hypothetical protein
VDLAGELRTCDGPTEAEAVLMAALGADGSPPWPDLVRAHRDAPWPAYLLCVLAARAGFPETLVRALPRDRPPLLAVRSPAIALAAVTSANGEAGLLHRIRAAGVLTDEVLLANRRPAREILGYASNLPGGDLLDRITRCSTSPCGRRPRGSGRHCRGCYRSSAERFPNSSPPPRVLSGAR